MLETLKYKKKISDTQNLEFGPIQQNVVTTKLANHLHLIFFTELK